MTPHLAWEKGGHAEVLKVEGDAIVLRSSTSAPPGARLSATFGAVTVKIKSHGTRKEADGTFRLEGRLIDATKDVRASLAALVSG
jgi:hypothetical protein